MSPIVINVARVMPDGNVVTRGWIMSERHYDALVRICEKYGLPAGDALIPAAVIPQAGEDFRQHAIELDP